MVAYGCILGSAPDSRTFAFPFAQATPPADTDWRPYDTPVRNQGQLGSCTAFGGCAALEADLARPDSPISAPAAILSPLYLYFYDRQESGLSTNVDTGATPLGLMKALARFGACPEFLDPYAVDQYQMPPSPQMQTAAAPYRIPAYYQVQGDLLTGLYAAIAGDASPVVAFAVYSGFEQVGLDGKVPLPRAGEPTLGGHLVKISGFFNDRSAPGGVGWVMIKNSWGEGWGDGGYGYLPTAYFTNTPGVEIWVPGWGSVPQPPGPQPPPEPGPEPDVNVQAIKDLTAQMRDMVKQAQADRCPYNATKATYQKSMAKIMDKDVGPFADVADQIDALLDEEPSPPGPSAISGVAVSYQNHSPARDCYLGYTDEQVQWGAHWGIPFIAPCDGVVSVYTFPTPLPAMKGDRAYMANHQALFGGKFICGMSEADLRATNQTMYFVLFVPNKPIAGLKALWFGHARGNAKVGPVKQGEWFGESWDSGIHFESAGLSTARASHVHCCASATGALTMNGDVDGLRAASVMGWDVQFIGEGGPGPDQYYTGAYTAGRLHSDFTQARQPIPPMPS